MQQIHIENRICPCCMELHDVLTVVINETTTFKEVEIKYDAIYDYCINTDTLFANEELLTSNYEAMKKEYDKLICKN